MDHEHIKGTTELEEPDLILKDPNYESMPHPVNPGTIENPKGNFNPEIPNILPHEQVYTIQVGDEIFRLSGASLSSDAPSYFTTFFLKYQDLPTEERPTLYIDRSPKVFSCIVSHLKGYYCIPKDNIEFVYLLLDANYYHLPRLIHQLSSSEIFVRIGHRSFRMQRNVFSNPGDSPNFFTLGFGAFFGSELDPPKSKRFIRPPPVSPPTVPNRSGDLFGDLLLVLQGSPVTVKNEEHRRLLMKECQYYRLRNLEQRLVEHSIKVNRLRQTEEITLNLEDIKVDQLTIQPVEFGNGKHKENTVFYKRPFVDSQARELVLQIKYNEQVVLSNKTTGTNANGVKANTWEAVFYDKAAASLKKIRTYFKTKQGVAFNSRTSAGHDTDENNDNTYIVQVEPDTAADIISNNSHNLSSYPSSSQSQNQDYESDQDQEQPANTDDSNEIIGLGSEPRKKRARTEDGPQLDLSSQSTVPQVRLFCEKSHWRIIKVSDEVGLRLVLLKAEGYTNERQRNKLRQFV